MKLAPVSILLVLGLSLPAQANVGEAYGWGSRSGAMSGAGSAAVADSNSAATNPAALAAPAGEAPSRVRGQLGILRMQPAFTSITGVVVENEFVSQKVTRSDVDTTYQPTFGQSIGLSVHPFGESFRRLSFGGVFYVPLDQIASLDTGEPFVPEYALYRARTRRPQAELGAGVQVWGPFHVGVGARLGFNLSSSANLYLHTDPAKASNMRFAANLAPRWAPTVGVYVNPGNNQDDAPLSGGLVYRFALPSAGTLSVRSGVQALGGSVALNFAIPAQTALFYDPAALEAALAWRQSSFSRTLAQVELQFWGAYVPPAMEVSGSEAGSSVVTAASRNPSFSFTNIVVPRIGQEFRLGEAFTLRAGYGYRPSVLKGSLDGAGNFLDPAKHMIAAGLSWVSGPWEVAAHFSWHALVSSRVTKTSGDELGNGSGDLKVGAPGYDVGGKIWGGGISLGFAL